MFSFRDKLRAVTATVELIREERIRSLSSSFDICSTCTQRRIMRLCSYGIRTWSVCGKQLQADCSQGNGRVDLRVKDTILVVIVLRRGFFQKHQASGKDAACMTYDQLGRFGDRSDFLLYQHSKSVELLASTFILQPVQ